MSQEEHKKDAPTKLNIAVISISSTKDITEDISGQTIIGLAKGHNIVSHTVVTDDKPLIRNEIRDIMLDSFNPVDVIITSGGTGLTKTDVTFEAIRPLFEKELVGFNPLFTNLSFGQIGPAAILSRSIAGMARGKIIFCLPGSPDACRLAMEQIIVPEIGHIIKHLEE